MARKTKAELAAEREAYEAAQRAEEVAAYPARLMAALEEATTKNNYELTVKDGLFELLDRDSYQKYTLTYHHNAHSQNDLEDLEFDMSAKARERAEAERRYAVKQAALAKLSDEERELLGL